MAQESNYIYGAHTEVSRIAEGSQTNVGLNVHRGLKVADVLPKYYELAKAGRIYCASSGVVANAVAPGADVATTAAQWALYNGNATGLGGLVLVVLSVGAWQASGTPAVNAALMVGMGSAAQGSAVTNNTGAAVKSTSGSSRTTGATLGASVTLAGAAAWHCLSGNQQTITAGVGGSFQSYDVDGMFIVPATFALGINILSGVGTDAKYGVSVVFAEVEAYLV